MGTHLHQIAAKAKGFIDRCVAVCCRLLQCVAVLCSVHCKCVAVCVAVLQPMGTHLYSIPAKTKSLNETSVFGVL